ncbi:MULTISPECIES: hypothetical protein [Streptomyces]|uniref:hypothetical protein n=1 Tax=Streptomyces TaxID=1883 RepID=UPI00103EC96F|nr:MULTISPECIES: hypothetical protein [Streptomyces]MBT3076078.1 hypothetical protein [Streptomyces sp. COG21]MBT3079411.1 hypothetical protein [Streptomyces sp. COG20]MBT3085649.1 hypothetical protein [Streptomyces sp. CYG21]MBT3096008.1 hypothetical protein [Streptomyces sp. CBG30]MBT3106724.1 hypothetical protein [Streptomyces sp. COG19]
MPDRRRRTAFRLPLPARAAALLTRERQSSSPDSPGASGSPGSSGASGSPGASGSTGSSGTSGSSSPETPAQPADDNPFAPPPPGRPDQPWQPRHPSGSDGNGKGDGEGEGSGSGRPSWGSQWSSRQPGRGGGGFGGRSGANGPGGKGGPDGAPGGMRWDPTDPVQRRARYALLGGIWAIFFALFDFPEIALLLGSLSVYWSISSLRAAPKKPSATDRTVVGGTAAPTPAPGDGVAPAATAPDRTGDRRPQTTAAISGLVTALLALIIVITTFTVQLVYRDYYTCVNDALTKTGALSCNEQLPKPLEPLFGVKE